MDNKKLMNYPLKIKWKNITNSTSYTGNCSIDPLLYRVGYFDGIIIVISVEPAVQCTSV
jgi:hypothetical protein